MQDETETTGCKSGKSALLCADPRAEFAKLMAHLGTTMENEQQSAETASRVEAVVMCELNFLEEWLLCAATPIGQECCGRAGTECCGCPDPVYLSAENVIEQMQNRHNEILQILRDRENT